MEESAFPQQQPIFMGGKLPLKPGLLLEATAAPVRGKGRDASAYYATGFDIMASL